MPTTLPEALNRKTSVTTSDAGRRGPAEHAVRRQIILAANEYFGRSGYEKTSVAELGRAIGFSKAYIYRFFSSKQAIGEAICETCLARLRARTIGAVASARTPADRFSFLFLSLLEGSLELLFQEKRLFEIAAHATAENWWPTVEHALWVKSMLESILLEGRMSGDFERQTALDETCRSILTSMRPFMNLIMLERHTIDLEGGATDVIALLLRSLACPSVIRPKPLDGPRPQA